MGFELRNGEEPPQEEEREGERDSALTSLQLEEASRSPKPSAAREEQEQNQDLGAKNRAAGRAKEGSELHADERCLKHRQARLGSSNSKIT
jgi:hypothetical protein